MHLFLIRHGESVGNRSGKIQGWIDFPLSELGKKQAELVARRFSDEKLDAIYSSDLVRAYETAKEIALKKGMTVRRWPSVREVYLGPFQGLTRKEIYEKYPEVKKKTILTSGVPETETVAELTERCRLVINDLQTKHDDERVAVVSHGGFISILLMYILTGEKWHTYHRPFQISNTSITHVEWKKNEKPVIHYVNETNHLRSLSKNIEIP